MLLCMSAKRMTHGELSPNMHTKYLAYQCIQSAQLDKTLNEVVLAVGAVLPDTCCACCAEAHQACSSCQDMFTKLALLVIDSCLLTSKDASAGVG